MRWDIEFSHLSCGGWVAQHVHKIICESADAHSHQLLGEVRNEASERRAPTQPIKLIRRFEDGLPRKITPEEFELAQDIVQRRAVKLYRWRVRLAEKRNRAGLFAGTAPASAVEMVLRQLEVDQVVHCLALRLNASDPPAEQLAGSIYSRARELVFRADAKVIKAFSSAVLEDIHVAKDASQDEVAFAALSLAQHTGEHPDCHGAFQSALKRLAQLNPRIWLYDLRFADFLSNHRLVNRGQILGTYTTIDDNGLVQFDPPLEDIELTERLRRRFKLETIEEFISNQRPQLRVGLGPSIASVQHRSVEV